MKTIRANRNSRMSNTGKAEVFGVSIPVDDPGFSLPTLLRERQTANWRMLGLLFVLACPSLCSAGEAFQGAIEVVLHQAGRTQTLSYAVGPNMMRIVRNQAERPADTINLVALDSGEITLVFPYNQSFVRLKRSADPSASAGFPAMPKPPAAVAWPAPPRLNPPVGVPETAPVPPAGMHARAAASSGRPQLAPTGASTNILGYVCSGYQLRQRDQMMEIWATDQLVPFHVWLQAVPPRHGGPKRLEACWHEPLRDANLFPLRAAMGKGAGAFKYEVTSIKPVKPDEGRKAAFQPPEQYHELAPQAY